MKDTYTRKEVIEILKECDTVVDILWEEIEANKYNSKWPDGLSVHPCFSPERIMGYPKPSTTKPAFALGHVGSNYKKIREIFE